MVDVVVEHDYTALEADELTIKKGDVIREVVKMKGGWWEGVLNDKRGMFPDNFVKEIHKDSFGNHKRKDVRTRQCRVLFSYKQDHLDELELNVGDIINIISEEEEGWWRGHLNGREGVFPSNFVEEIKFKLGSRENLTDINEIDKTPTLPPKPTKIMCQVKYSYKAQNDDELDLTEGDLINLISKDVQDPGWWKGELNGQIGVFPDNFVLILENHERKLNKFDNVPSKSSTIATQRKSLGEKLDVDTAIGVNPSVSAKKPAVPVKKSPSGGSSQSGILAGLRKKIVDSTTSSSKNHSQVKVSETRYELKEVERTVVVTDVNTMAKATDIIDGSSSSKSQPQLMKVSEIKEEFRDESFLENAFDHVERSSMLSDVRATRAKAPGRRPPSVIFKDGEPGVVNGNTDHIHMDMLIESLSNTRPTSMHDQGELAEAKPRVREWEKHKAPWLEEMKLNQAKRTSTSPSNEPSKLKLTPSDKSGSPDSDEVKSPLEKVYDVLTSSTSAVTSLSKTSPNIDKHPVVLRNKNPQVSVRPQTISNNDQHKHDPQKLLSINNVQTGNQNNKSVTNQKSQVASASTDIKATGDVNQDSTSETHYMELLQRIEKLEILVEFQQQMYTTAIEELKGKILRLESDIGNPHFNV